MEVIRALALVLALLLAGCETLPPVELCYTHPVYGNVCVVINGKKHYRDGLTPEQRAEIDKWIAEGAKP